LLGRPLTDAVLGPEWSALGPLLGVLGVSSIFRAVVVLNSELCAALGRPRQAVQVNLLRLAVLAAAAYPLLRGWGVMGMAVAVLLSAAAGAALSSWLMAAALRAPAAGDAERAAPAVLPVPLPEASTGW
jgi:O-antigen/teichoic acid export membrane protein